MFNLFKKKKIIVTHSGTFHADDIFACATLSLHLKKQGIPFKIVRTRDEEMIHSGDFVVDVGGFYNQSKNLFDHHQKQGSGLRANGIPYASFGLVWKAFGLDLCGGDSDVWQNIDTDIASPIDAVDNGLDVTTSKFDGITTYGASRTFLIYAPTWQEDSSSYDSIFLDQVKRASLLLAREIEVAKSNTVGRKIILDAYHASSDKRIIELKNDFPRYLYQDTLAGVPEPLYVVYPSGSNNTWKVEAIHKPNTMESRKSFPEDWRGFQNNDPKFAEVTGVSDVLFSHKGGFLIGVKSRAGALSLAEKATLA